MASSAQGTKPRPKRSAKSNGQWHQIVLPVQEFRFVSGNDKKYDRERRAFVLRRSQAERCNRGRSKRLARDNASMGRSGTQLPRTKVDNCVLVFDPFNSTARPLNEQGKHLIHEWIAFGQRMWSREAADARNPHIVLLNNTKDSEVAVLTIETWGAYFLASHNCLPAHVALAKRVELIKLINRVIRSQTVHDDATIAAVLGITDIAAEACSTALRAPHQHETVMHLRGAARMIELRGGLGKLRSWVRCYFRWVDIVNWGELSAAIYQLQNPVPAVQIAGPSNSTSDGFQVQGPVGALSFLTRALVRFIHTYTAAYQHAQTQSQSTQNGDPQCHPSAIFGPGSKFHGMVRQQVIEGGSHRIALLIYTSFVVIDCAGNGNRLLARLAATAMRRNLLSGRKDASAEGMLWALISTDEDYTMEHPHYVDIVTQCLYVVKRLDPCLQRSIDDAFAKFLTAAVPADLDGILNPLEMQGRLLRHFGFGPFAGRQEIPSHLRIEELGPSPPDLAYEPQYPLPDTGKQPK